MINYRYEVNQCKEQDCFTVKIYANSDLMNMYIGCVSEKEASETGQAFIDGVKFARGE
jgi:hypothetical protein